ncbi:T9SS type A sorting domain-containing protein [Phaeodactylibacter sp.]|uniref:T9SS type A sorting domain-containing protein n=1 Tax=Phaeodactylibacter sp. TaxID=1940289 RepID=UPI0025E7C931|nr:T9SS type A sorting domain-containing protein [Phaeodactylibacter sp.]MCI4648400.1 T9SS type A sorting domain-containing protein [Phaeodactylibacter sp.]MCI5094130.1 T9SS type A sorting domain-containing protein [Phaeodactylibacter sp.]
MYKSLLLTTFTFCLVFSGNAQDTFTEQLNIPGPSGKLIASFEEVPFLMNGQERFIVARRSEHWEDVGWIAVDSTFYELSASGQLIMSEILDYDEDTGWTFRSRYFPKLTDFGKIETFLVEEWNSSEWVPSQVDTFAYNSDQLLTYKWTYLFDPTAIDWMPWSRDSYDYISGVEIPILRIGAIWNSDEETWVNKFKFEATINEHGKDSTLTFFQYTGGAWIPTSKFSKTYNQDGLVVEAINQQWIDGSWVNINKEEIETLDDGLLTIVKNYLWLDGIAEWYPTTCITTELDSLGWTNRRLEQQWDTDSESYLNFQLGEFENFDTYSVFTNQIWSAEESVWINQSRYFNFFETFTATIEPEPQSSISVYPNPSEGTITVDLSHTRFQQPNSLQIRCTDLQGRTLIVSDVEPFESTLELALPNMPNGTYILSLSDGRQIWRQKIVVQR